MLQERLKSCRIKKRLTQKEMSEFLGITPNAYQKYENGMRVPAYPTLIKLADFFNVTTDYLLGRTD